MKPVAQLSTRVALSALAVFTALTGLSGCSRQADDELDTRPRDAAVVADTPTAPASQAQARAASDMGITAKVNAALVADDQLKATQINVDTRDGQVTLSGQAPDTASRERATTLAAAVDGVKQVNNQLVVSRSS